CQPRKISAISRLLSQEGNLLGSRRDVCAVLPIFMVLRVLVTLSMSSMPQNVRALCCLCFWLITTTTLELWIARVRKPVA
ncbi:hypothetical protein V1523DRAFT_452103, partial [Lipomyces doorenjongii]